jgi:hypothetical protein
MQHWPCLGVQWFIHYRRCRDSGVAFIYHEALIQLPSAPEGGPAQSQQTVHMQPSRVGSRTAKRSSSRTRPNAAS